MFPDKKCNNLAIYIIAHNLHHRLKLLLHLKNIYQKVVPVSSYKEKKIDSTHIRIKPWLNPTGILRIAGLHKLKNILDKHIFFPSTSILFVASAKKQLKTEIQKDLKAGRKVCIITCVPPHGLALLGSYLKKEFPTIHWIIDWQDLWSYDEYYFHLVPKKYKNKLLKLEQKLLNSCNLNLTTNYNAANLLENRYGINPNKISAINHPYDEAELADLSQKIKKLPIFKPGDTITIGFLGTLSKPPKVPGSRVLKAIDDTLENKIDIKFHIFGDPTELTKNTVKEMKHQSVIIHEQTSHMNSLRKISECDFLLITLSDLPNCNVIMHAKLPHYLMLNKPILAMVPIESFVADVITKTGTGFVIPSDTDWGEELKKILLSYMKGELPINRNEDSIKKFSLNEISKQWVNAINRNPD